MAHWLTVIRAQVLSGLTERQLNFPRTVPDAPVAAQLTGFIWIKRALCSWIKAAICFHNSDMGVQLSTGRLSAIAARIIKNNNDLHAITYAQDFGDPFSVH